MCTHKFSVPEGCLKAFFFNTCVTLHTESPDIPDAALPEDNLEGPTPRQSSELRTACNYASERGRRRTHNFIFRA
eukprot:1148330-Pelagomonas_calceolata.AAC.2